MNSGFFESAELVRVKICGITQERDAREAIEAGADALGFNFWPGSKRFLKPEGAFAWIRELPAVTRIAVLVNPEPELLARVSDAGCFDAIQFHGDESPEFCRDHGGPRWIRAFAVQPETPDFPSSFSTSDFLMDAPSAQYGGSGKTADWNLAAEMVRRYADRRFSLAGGLTPENVAAAVRAVRPHGVDVASGVEKRPGVKDAAKVLDFIQQAKSAGS